MARIEIRKILSNIVSGTSAAWKRTGEPIARAGAFARRLRSAVTPYLLVIISCALLAEFIMDSSPLKISITVLSLVAAAVFWKNIHMGVVLLLALCASAIYPEALPKPVTLGGQGFHLTEFLLMGMVAAVFVKACSQRQIRLLDSPMFAPGMLFVLSILVSMLVSYRDHMNSPLAWGFSDMYNAARALVFYLLFFIVVDGLKTEKELKIALTAFIGLGAFVSVMMLAQYVVGTKMHLFLTPGAMAGSVRVEGLSQDEQDITRSLPPGIFSFPLLFLMALLSSCAVTGRKRVLFLLASAVIAAGVLLTFTRNLWILISLSVILALALAGRELRPRVGKSILAVVLIGVLGFGLMFATSGGGHAKRLASVVGKRLTSIVDRGQRAQALSGRAEENRYAIQQIKRHPITGIGVASIIGYRETGVQGTDYKELQPITMLHNSYLEIWLSYGILGLVAMVWGSLRFLAMSYRLMRRTSVPWRKTIALSAFCSYVVCMLASTVAMTFLHSGGYICTVAFTWGIVEALTRLEREESLAGSALATTDAAINLTSTQFQGSI